MAARLEIRRPSAPEMGAVTRLTGDELVERFPPLRGDLDGLWIEGGGRVDRRLLCAGLVTAVGRRTVLDDALALAPGLGDAPSWRPVSVCARWRRRGCRRSARSPAATACSWPPATAPPA
ncbi:MAG: hypothetical protein QM733_01985 [Ilumatobacteraceae bacterium]